MATQCWQISAPRPWTHPPQARFPTLPELAAFFAANVSAVVGPHGTLRPPLMPAAARCRPHPPHPTPLTPARVHPSPHIFVPAHTAGGAFYNPMFFSAPDTFLVEFLPMSKRWCCWLLAWRGAACDAHAPAS